MDNDCQTESGAEPAVMTAALAAVAAIKSKKKAFKLPEATPWPLTNTWRTIQLIYADKIKADAVDDACHNPRQTMAEYVDDWFKNQ